MLSLFFSFKVIFIEVNKIFPSLASALCDEAFLKNCLHCQIVLYMIDYGTLDYSYDLVLLSLGSTFRIFFFNCKCATFLKYPVLLAVGKIFNRITIIVWSDVFYSGYYFLNTILLFSFLAYSFDILFLQCGSNRSVAPIKAGFVARVGRRNAGTWSGLLPLS